MKRITINDIAKRAGVTKGTVSMVLNGSKRISEATRARVLDIVKELDYHPNESARTLAKGRTEAIAFIATRFAAPFISTVLNALEQRAFFANKYVHGITPYSTRNEESVKEEHLKRILHGRLADAVVMLTIKPSQTMVDSYEKAGIPLILVENSVPNAHSITIDNYSGASKAATHFTRENKKKICLVVGETVQPPSRDNNMPAYDRRKGFIETLAKNGYSIPDKNIEIIHAYHYEEGRRSLDNLYGRGVRPDAVFVAAGDTVAMGLIERAAELGIKIPDDMAVIGYDDTEVARHLNPPLTTIRQPLDEVGVMAFDLAVDAIEGRVQGWKHFVMDPKLIIRKSA